MLNSNEIAPLALTLGDPGGVGGELTIKAWQALRKTGPTFFLIACPTHMAKLGRAQDVEISPISAPSDARSRFSSALPVLPLTTKIQVIPGKSDAHNAAAVIESIERAVALTLKGHASGVVTNPIQKSTLQSHGFRFPGHTEFLASLTAAAPMPQQRERGAVMMLAGPALKTVPITIHHSVIDAINALTPKLIVDTSLIVAQSLAEDFGIPAPRLAISGLNPHAGEDGTMGAEDGLIIAPAVDTLRDLGIDARGPLPADTMFHSEARATYDVALCMLHDQALIPAKTLAFHDAVNLTLGLPIIRTSPDHGTALNIAGRGTARADSLIAAIKLAATMAANRSKDGHTDI